MEHSFTLLLENPQRGDKARHLECFCHAVDLNVDVESLRDIFTQELPSTPEELPDLSVISHAASLSRWANENPEVFTEGKTTKDLGRQATIIKRRPK